MKHTIIKNIFLKNKNTMNIDNLNFSINSSYNIEEEIGYQLVIELELFGLKVFQKETEIENVSAVINKLEQYQKGKLSSKEIKKMANKISGFQELGDIYELINSEKKLDEQDILILTSSNKHSDYLSSFKHNNISKIELFIDKNKIEIIDSDSFLDYICNELEENILDNEIQDKLKFLYDEQEEEKIAEQIDKIKNIFGDESKNNKEKKVQKNKVEEYLKEKQKLIKENAPSEFLINLEFPMPQANNLERIIELGSEIYNSGETKIDLVVLENDLDKRDVHYYSRALCYLGLAVVDNKSREMCLTYNGENFFKTKNESERKDIILKILNTDPIVEKFLNNSLNLEDSLQLKEFEARGITSISTINRRLTSLKSWINFLSC